MSDLKNLKKLKSIDIDEFNGVKTVIESITLTDVEKKDFGDGEKDVRQLLIKTANLSDNEENPITASEYISLKYDENEGWGYSDSPKSKAMQFLKFYKVTEFEDLINKECMVLKKQKESGKEYLGIQF